MTRPYKIILLIAIAITCYLFIADWINDNPGPDYPEKQIVVEILVIGITCTLIFFGAISLMYFIANLILKIARKRLFISAMGKS